MAKNLDARAFAGTAEAYLRFRPPYPPAMLAEILERAETPAGARVLDLACGPGRVALALADRAKTIEAVDLEPDMIAVGRAEAARRDIGNIAWSLGRAEDHQAAPASLDLITIGDAFHRLDQARIAALAIGWLRPGGALAILGCPTRLMEGGEPWQDAVRNVVVEHTRAAFPNGWAPSATGETGVAPGEAALRAAGFACVQSHTVPTPVTWTVASICGFLATTSVAGPRIIGPDRAAFDAAIAEALLGRDPSGVYPEE